MKRVIFKDAKGKTLYSEEMQGGFTGSAEKAMSAYLSAEPDPAKRVDKLMLVNSVEITKV